MIDDSNCAFQWPVLKNSDFTNLGEMQAPVSQLEA
jgi:hypothetical protein